jgi:hypothetical protein
MVFILAVVFLTAADPFLGRFKTALSLPPHVLLFVLLP